MASPPTTRARSKTPLPAVQAKPSQAYGAPGKANLKAQVRTTTNFGQIFQSRRQAADIEEEREEEEDEVSPASSPVKQRGWRRIINSQPAEMGAAGRRGGEREEAVVGRISDRTMTALDAGAEYDGRIDGRPAEIVPVYEPSKIRDLLLFASMLVLLINVWAFIPLSNDMAATRDGFFLGMKQLLHIHPYDAPPAEVEARWHRYKHDEIFSKALPDHNMPDLQWAININFLQRIENVEAKVESTTALMTSQQLEKLAKVDSLHNTYEALRTINWFSIGLGARVDPRHTSPTQQSGSGSWLDTAFRWINPLSLAPNRPITALQRWDETTDSWCASLSDEGSVQIAIHTAFKFYPQSLVVEHIPEHGTRNIDAAPREIEIWAHAGSKSRAKEIRKAMKEEHQFNGEGWCGSPPSSEYVCLGKDDYHIHNWGHIQTIRVTPNTFELGLDVNRFIIRANTNWGAKWTCFYRLRMTGKEVESTA